MDISQSTFTIPSLSTEEEASNLETFIMAKYIWEAKTKIAASLPILQNTMPNIANIFNDVIQFIQADKKPLSSIAANIRLILSTYNFKIRLCLPLDKLACLHQSYSTNTLPCQTPCEYIDSQTNWILKNEVSWIGHGYYWQCGGGKKDTSSAYDYDCFEPNFYFLKKSKVIAADYPLLRHDFASLKDKTEQEINNWLINQCSYISEGQIARLQKGGDTNSYIQINDLNEYIDFTRKRTTLRQRGFGRATTFIIDDSFKIQNERFIADFICTKGCGTQKLATDFTKKENGLLSMVDAFKEYAMQKLVQKIADLKQKDIKEECKWGTVQTYAIIDTGLSSKENCINPGTGYSNERYGLTVRQAHSRYVASYDEPAFYSVVPTQNQKLKQFDEFKNHLMDFGITSEQEPRGEILSMSRKERLNDEETSWNIQSDSTGYRMVDFSQYYVLPTSPLNNAWKMSHEALTKGVMLGWGWKYVIDNKTAAKNIFGIEDKNEIKKIIEAEKEKNKSNVVLGSCLGLKKPQYCWSWFLEVDDSGIGKWAFDRGTYWTQESSVANPIKQMNEWLP